MNNEEREALLARIPVEDDCSDASQTSQQDQTRH